MSKETSRELLERALAHQECSRVPYDQSSRSSAIEEEPYIRLKQALGLETETTCYLRSHADIEEPVRNLLGIDTEFVRCFPEHHWVRSGKQGNCFTDAWGVPWLQREDSYYYEIDSYPLKDTEYTDILSQKWTPLISKETAVQLRCNAEFLYEAHDSALFSDQIGAGIFERAWYLRGLEQFLMDMMLEKNQVHRYLEKILQHQMEGYATLFEAVGPYITGILLTDDLATQESLLFSRELYREMIFPYQKRLLEFINAFGKKVIFHSCGAVSPLIPDLLEAGVEILHPIQHSARGMNPVQIKHEYGRDLTLWGAGMDTSVLQTASPEEIESSVTRDLYELQKDGGFVYTTTHCIQPGTPPENILAMTAALRGSSLSEMLAEAPLCELLEGVSHGE